LKELRLTNREFDIMKVLWESELALSSREITNADDSLNQNTVQATIRTLLKRKLITIDSIGYSGKVLTRKYKPLLQEDDYYNSLMTSKGTNNLIATFINKSDLNELKEIEKMIIEKKNEIDKKQ